MTTDCSTLRAVRVATKWLSVLCVSGTLACSGESSSSTSPRVLAPLAAKTPAEVIVSGTAPDSASQDTTLDVTISGSGFVAGSAAQWALAGVTDPAQVRTNGTRFVNSRTLVANITISLTATIGKWDVIVAAGSKGGIGTEVFTVKPTGKAPPQPVSTFFLPNNSQYLLRGDGLYVEGSSSAFSGMSRYLDSECGVQSLIYAASGSGDAVMGSNNVIDRKCVNYPRGVRLTFSLINNDGSTTADGAETVGTFITLQQLQKAAAFGNPGVYIPVGESAMRNMFFNDKTLSQPTSSPKFGKCAGLRFVPILADGTVTGSDQLLVTRTAADTWIVQTLADETDPLTLHTIHHDKVWCQNNGKLYHMPVYFAIKAAAALTP